MTTDGTTGSDLLKNEVVWDQHIIKEGQKLLLQSLVLGSHTVCVVCLFAKKSETVVCNFPTSVVTGDRDRNCTQTLIGTGSNL